MDERLERLAKLKRLLPAIKQLRVMDARAAMVPPDAPAGYGYRRGSSRWPTERGWRGHSRRCAFQPRAW